MSEFWAGLLGVVVGACVTLGGILLQHYLTNRDQKKLDDIRKKDLLHMLHNPPPGQEWRKLDTLARVIGADYETTRRLLIELGARGSETESDAWALKTRKPLP